MPNTQFANRSRTLKQTTVIKKRIRGLKRRQKNVDAWFDAHRQVDFSILEKHHYYYCKAKIDPWSNLYYDVPYPSAFSKQLFSHLLTIYSLWESQLKNRYQNFYLSIWIYDNRFIVSIVVAAIGDRMPHYRQMLDEQKTSVPFPIHLFTHEKERIKEFDWFSADDNDYIAVSEFQDVETEGDKEDRRTYKKLLRNNTPTQMIGDEKHFIIKRGNVWIGKK